VWHSISYPRLDALVQTPLSICNIRPTNQDCIPIYRLVADAVLPPALYLSIYFLDYLRNNVCQWQKRHAHDPACKTGDYYIHGTESQKSLCLFDRMHILTVTTIYSQHLIHYNKNEKQQDSRSRDKTTGSNYSRQTKTAFETLSLLSRKLVKMIRSHPACGVGTREKVCSTT
jgi:hypothetical protein